MLAITLVAETDPPGPVNQYPVEEGGGGGDGGELDVVGSRPLAFRWVLRRGEIWADVVEGGCDAQ